MFITEYRPTQDWLLDQTESFDGEITTYHDFDLKEDPGDDGGGGSGGGGGPEDGTAYPHDCEGEVITSQIMVPYPCGCGDWPWEECDGCYSNSPQYPGYEWRTAYECYEPSTGEDPQDPDPDPSGGGGGNSTDDPDPELHSITILMPDGSTMATPEILTNELSLNPDETQMLTENMTFSDKVYFFYANNQFSEEAKAFANHAIDAFENGGEVDIINEAFDIFEDNSDITWEHIENWFLNEQTEFGPNLNINPDLITYDAPLQQEALPSLADFVDNFPKLGVPGNYYAMPSPDVYQLVGGTLWTSHINDIHNNYQNACAIRGSRGLLYSGIPIPVLHYNGSQRTQKGGDNKNYILDAVSFDKFMRDKFGATTYELTGATANDQGRWQTC